MKPEILTAAKNRASICYIFGNPRRVLILWALADGEKSVGEIANTINASLQNTSQHLRIMKDKSVVLSRRDGQTVYYRVAENDLLHNCPAMMQTPKIELTRE